MVTPLVKRPGPEVGRAAGSVLGGAENPPLSRNRGFQNLLFGYFLSGLGDQLYYVALPLMIYDLYRSPIASSSLRAVEFLPTALFGLVIGLLLDRYSRKRLLIGGLLVQALWWWSSPWGPSEPGCLTGRSTRWLSPWPAPAWWPPPVTK